MKKDFKHSITNPIKYYNKNTTFEEMEKIEVTLELCTIHKNMPFGPAIITYTDSERESKSFKGAGVFDEEGELKTFTAMEGNRWGFLMNNMHHGRPKHHSYYTEFYPQGYTANVHSIKEKTDVSGW